MVTSSTDGIYPHSSQNNTPISTLNRQELKAILPSGIITGQNITSTLKPSAKDSLKRKLTARVTPMSRNDGDEDLHKSLDNDCGNDKKAVFGENNFPANGQLPRATTSALTTASIATTATVMVKTEKPDVLPCNGASLWSHSAANFHPGFESYEPQAKYRRRIVPSMTNTIPTRSNQYLVPSISSEPKLLGENIATMSLLTASQGHLATLQDDDGDTPLHIAIAQGQIQLVQYLTHLTLTSGISLDIYNKLKQTPLHVAVITNQPLIIRILINAGVDVNVPDRNGQTAVHLACQRSSIECLMELINCRHKINLETKNYAGLTPMHEAVMSNSLDIIRFLISYGANLDSKDGKSGRTPLHYAVEQELVPVVELLIHSGANVSAATFSGSTPIQAASGRGMSHITRLLLGSSNEGSGRNSGSRWSSSPSSSKAKGSTFKR